MSWCPDEEWSDSKAECPNGESSGIKAEYPVEEQNGIKAKRHGWCPDEEWGGSGSSLPAAPPITTPNSLHFVNDLLDSESVPRAPEAPRLHLHERSTSLLENLLIGLKKHPGFFDLRAIEQSVEEEPPAKRCKVDIPFPTLPHLNDSSQLWAMAPLREVDGCKVESPLFAVPWFSGCQPVADASSLSAAASKLMDQEVSASDIASFASHLKLFLHNSSPSKRQSVMTVLLEQLRPSAVHSTNGESKAADT